METIDHNVQLKLSNIFSIYTTSRRDEMKKIGGRFVHYTSAENAIKILRSKRVWMRNARCMNDYSEIDHGHDLLLKSFNDVNFKRMFYEVLEPCGSEVHQRALDLFDQWWHNIHNNTFITSISEHDSEEDSNGRLSMWRAYGQQSAKAAIVFKPTFDNTLLKLFLVPTAYYSQAKLNEELKKVINNIKNDQDFLASLDDQTIINAIFGMLLLTTVSLKHEGFREEREWRIIYLPEMMPSKLMLHTIETINGIPQSIYQIPLDDNQIENVDTLTIPKLFEKIIIGPSDYPLSLYDAFKKALEEAGIDNPASRVIVSNIPLRA
ncbi:MAG: DUF2971 domain-containing protein [Deltaproteobacteria bacterium]